MSVGFKRTEGLSEDEVVVSIWMDMVFAVLGYSDFCIALTYFIIADPMFVRYINRAATVRSRCNATLEPERGVLV